MNCLVVAMDIGQSCIDADTCASSRTSGFGSGRCHCVHEHEECCALAEARGCCLCESFVLVRCRSLESVSKDTWNVFFSFKLGSLIYDLWSITSEQLYVSSSSGTMRENVYRILVRVQSLETRDNIMGYLDNRHWSMQLIEKDCEYSFFFECNSVCCMEEIRKEIESSGEEGCFDDDGDGDEDEDEDGMQTLFEQLAIV